MNHVIRQYRLHIEFNGGESEALALQSRLSGYCQTRMFPALERALDRCVPNTERWSLEQLEIDAGTIDLERLEPDLPALVERALEQALRTQPPSGTYLRSVPATDGVTQRSTLQSLEEAWAYFLTTGSLPWNFRLPEGEQLEATLLKFWQENPSSPISGSVLTALQSANARKRLVRQFSEAFLTRLLERAAPDLKIVMTGLLRKLQGAKPPTDIAQLFVGCLWEATLANLHTATRTATETEIVCAAWQKLPVTIKQKGVLSGLLMQHWPEVSAAVDNPYSAEKSPTTTETASEASEPTKNRARLVRSFKTASIDSAETEFASVFDDEQTKPHPDAAEGLYIANAGLVLLHPFLPRLFQALDMTDGDAITQPDLALCLLHFLATGQSTAPEYELILPKVLCNIPLTMPIASAISLSATETEEAEALLAAVIRHWDVLKNTGIDGLRGTFLLRAGKIVRREDGDWLLQVENQAYDILLAQLPWGMGAIKLPWMDTMLWVEWTN